MSSFLVSLAAGASAGLASSLLAQRWAAVSQPEPPAAPPPPPEPPAPTAEAPPEPAPAAPPQEALAALLPKLSRALMPLADDLDHPGELPNMPEFQAVVEAFRRPDAGFPLLSQYALGGNWPFACAAFTVLADHPERQSLCAPVLRHLENARPFVLMFALRFLASLENRPPVGAALLGANQWWANNQVIPGFYDEYLQRRAEQGDAPDFGNALAQKPGLDPAPVEALLAKLQHGSAAKLIAALKKWSAQRIDRAFLGTVGTLLDPADHDPLLITPPAWQEFLDTAEAVIQQTKPRSVLVTGEPRTGKTAFIEILGQVLQEAGFTVFAASAAELMADQMYIGQLEGRVKKLVDALHARRKIVWYIGDLAQLADSGRHKGQTASLLDQIFPALATGDLIIIGECTPAAATQLLQARPSLRALLEILALQPMSESDTLGLLTEMAARVSAHAGIAVSDQAVGTTMELAQHYLSSFHLPGSVLELLKRAVNRSLSNKETALTASSVIATLSQLSGLPQLILDTKRRVDLGDVEKFFAGRVIGQEEAVRAVVDRIAMLKAGLTDPGRPTGVFLFAGPTGTGKTELAKTLAEFLFGSPDRMARLDMSEFQTPDSNTKILGQRGESGSDSLIDRIRKQPFSVVLLDEFEKAHANTWDLFLQIFDDGRLSDANGRVADFRHCFIILTSNLGAAMRRGGAFGFRADDETDIEEQVLQTVSQTFRPEFINRLDKIIVFRPLSRDLMRSVLHKELARVQERRGLRERAWAVEWESSAIELLLDRGFSREMGARPLKRAIDQLLLAPLAATLVEHRFPQGDQFLFVRAKGKRIEVEFVDPDGGAGEASAAPAEPEGTLSLSSIVLCPTGSAAERATLSACWRDIFSTLAGDAWAEANDRLQASLADPAFWSGADRFRTLSAIEVADRVKEAARTAERLFQRYAASGEQSARASRELAGRVALQLLNLRRGLQDIEARAPADALLRVEPAMESADAIGWCRTLAGMYKQWGEKRRMQVAEIGPGKDGRLPILQITGFGAFRTLQPEAGLHVYDEMVQDATRRLVARVSVVAGPEQDFPKAGRFAAASKLFGEMSPGSVIVRRYRRDPTPMVRDAVQGWRSGRLDAILAGDFDLME